MSITNENVADILSRATAEQRGVEVDGRAIGPTSPWVRAAERLPEVNRDVQIFRRYNIEGLKYQTGFSSIGQWNGRRWVDSRMGGGAEDIAWWAPLAGTPPGELGEAEAEAAIDAEKLAQMDAPLVPPCLAQQFGIADAIGRQMGETSNRCDERASEEEAGGRMTGERFDGQG